MTQLVGRILRQPFARKTQVLELDESYVFCFRQRANILLGSIREGFAQEGLGDLRGHIAAEDESTATDKELNTDYERVYVVETKGLHLKDNAKTNYIRKVFDICTRQAKSRNRNELGLEMKDKILRFEVLAEDEWEAKLNEILA